MRRHEGSKADVSAPADGHQPRGSRGWLFAVVTILIAYGSLYPFDLKAPASISEAWNSFFTEMRFPTSRGDLLGNVILFVPFGIVGAGAIPARSHAVRVGVTLLAAAVLAVGLQASQIYLPSRSPALGDAVLNLAGTVVGLAVGWIGAAKLVGFRSAFPALPAALFVLWLATELIPFVPALDWEAIKASLKPLAQGDLSVTPAAVHAAGVLLAGELLTRFAAARRAAVTLALAGVGVLVAKVFVDAQRLDVSAVVGFAVGFAGSLGCRLLPPRRRAGTVAAALLATFVFASLAPFKLAESPNKFLVVPFEGLLQGSMLTNLRSLLASSLSLAGVLWIVKELGGSVRAAAIGLAGLALLLEAAQIYIDGRTPELTAPLIALVLGLAIAGWPEAAAKGPSRSTPPAGPVARSFSRRRSGRSDWCVSALQLTIASAIIAVAIAAVLHLPGIPYNLAELFRADGLFPVLLIFSTALLWTGAGPAVAAAWVNASPRRDWLLPLAGFFAALVSLALLWASVTDESIDDVVGSSNVNWFVINRDIWGTWARGLFLAVDAPGVIGFVERCVRYAALYGPVVMFPAVFFLVADTIGQGSPPLRRIGVWVASAALWLWLCKAIAFDWSSTDNLNELIAREGFFGLGGGGYLYLLVAMISANIVLLARIPIRALPMAGALAVTALLVPCGWWLVSHGLEPRVEKYGLVFSGTQFLLGQNRSTLLGTDALFLRWSALQLGAVIVASVGARLARPVTGAHGRMRPDAGRSTSAHTPFDGDSVTPNQGTLIGKPDRR